MNSKLRGAAGEAAAAEFLRKKKYKLTGMNYRTRFGEIDIIAENKHHLVFVEVKLRKASGFMMPREYVDARKQMKLRNTAEIWLQNNETKLQPRFDVIEVIVEGERISSINHIENAF